MKSKPKKTDGGTAKKSVRKTISGQNNFRRRKAKVDGVGAGWSWWRNEFDVLGRCRRGAGISFKCVTFTLVS